LDDASVSVTLNPKPGHVPSATAGSGGPSGVSDWARKLKPLAAGSASQLARTLLLQVLPKP